MSRYQINGSLTCIIITFVAYSEDILKVFEGLTKRLIELFGMGLIINLLVNAFFGSVVWYFTTFGKFIFYSN